MAERAVTIPELLASLDETSVALRRIETELTPPAPAAVVEPEPDYTAEDADEMPCTWGECQTRGLGAESPCPFYSCRHHLGIDVSPDGELRILIPVEQIEEVEETCSIAAASRAWAPEEIAVKIGLSLGGFELVQRHAWLKANAEMGRVRDESRGVEMDVDGVPDARR